MDSETIARMTKDCNAVKFSDHIATTIVGQLSKTPTRDELEMAFRLLQQALYIHHIENKCKATTFRHLHKCTLAVWQEAFERLRDMERRLAPAALPPSTPRKRKTVTAPQPVRTTEEMIG